MDTSRALRALAAAPERAWQAAQDAPALAAAMPAVDMAEVLESRQDGEATVQTVRWTGWLIAGSLRRKMVWTEEDTWTREPLECRYRQVEGTFKEYAGRWTFAPEEGGCVSEIVLDYDAGIPLVGAIVARLVDKIVTDNLEALLGGLAAVLGE